MLNYNPAIGKVKITQNGNGDTRSADHIPTISEFDDANNSHQSDVNKLVERFCTLLKSSAKSHDWSKVTEPYRSMFYRDMVATLEGRLDFMEGEWAHLHYEGLERHHLNQHVPDDVNLFDVIEMVCDCVAAGMARYGELIQPIKVSSEILQLALTNTVNILIDQIELD